MSTRRSRARAVRYDLSFNDMAGFISRRPCECAAGAVQACLSCRCRSYIAEFQRTVDESRPVKKREEAA